MVMLWVSTQSYSLYLQQQELYIGNYKPWAPKTFLTARLLRDAVHNYCYHHTGRQVVIIPAFHLTNIVSSRGFAVKEECCTFHARQN